MKFPAIARLPALRVVRTKRLWFTLTFWILLPILTALSAHSRSASHGSSTTLLNLFGPFVVPLIAYTFTDAVLAGGNLSKGIEPLTWIGGSPSRSTIAVVLTSVVASAITCALLGSITAVIGHGSSDPSIRYDAFTSAWIGALGASAYASLFTLASILPGKSFGRTLAFFVDWMMSDGRGTLALIAPRLHVRNLLGGDAAVPVSAHQSEFALAGFTLVASLFAVLFSFRKHTAKFK